MGKNWREKREALVLDGLARLKPDVVCFQEATVRYEPVLYDQAQAIGEAIGLPFTVFSPYGNVVETMSREQGGIAVIGRWPIRLARHRRLPPGHGANTDARVALLVSFQAPSGNFDVVTTHLSWRPEELEVRLVQMGLVAGEFSRADWDKAGARAVLVGDFNAIEKEPAILLLSDCLTDAFRAFSPNDPGYTWVPENPYAGEWPFPPRRLDYIFCSRGTQILAAEVVLQAPPVSDHFGLLAELEWADPRRA